MKNKIKALVLVGMVVLVLAACGKTDDGNTQRNTENEKIQETETDVNDNQNEEVNTEEQSTEVVSSESEMTDSETVIPESEIPNSENNQATDNTQAKPAWTVTEMSKTMYAKSSVNVRKGPGTNHDILGRLSKNAEVKVSGKCNEYDWYRIEYNGDVAYVSASYLVDQKVVEEAPSRQYAAYVKAAMEVGYYNLAEWEDENGRTGYSVMVHSRDSHYLGTRIMDVLLAEKGLYAEFRHGGFGTDKEDDMHVICTYSNYVREITEYELERVMDPTLRYKVYHVSEDGTTYYDDIKANRDILYFETITVSTGRTYTYKECPEWLKDENGDAYYVKKDGTKVYPGFKYPFEY